MTEKKEKFVRGERAAKISFVAVLIIGVVKAITGLSTGSISLTAQAIDSLTDLFALIAVFVGLRIASKPPSERFPYGYYRVETLVSVIIAGLILITGAEILWESARRVFNPEYITNPSLAIVISILSIPILYALSKYIGEIGNDINSQALKSQAGDFKADIYSSVLVLMGVGSSFLGFPQIEGLTGAIISLLVLKMGLTLGWESILMLMDAAVDLERLENIRDTIKKISGVRDAYHVRIRRAGPLCFGEVTIGIDQRVPVDQAHRLTEEIEEKAKEKYPMLESLIIHVEPQELSRLEVALPILEDQGIKSPTTKHFGEAKYFLLVELEDNKIQGWKTVPNPALGKERKKGISISNKLLGEGVTTLITSELGEGPYHILKDSFVDIFLMRKESNAEEVIKEFIEGDLEPFKK